MNRMKEFKPQIKEVWRLSLPAILTQITTIAMQYIDSAMVGSLGANASAAIGLVSTSTWLLSGMIYAVSAGFSVQVAHEIGAENDQDARHVVKHGLWSALVVSGLSCLIGVLLSKPLPGWLGGEEILHRDASLYFLVFALMLPFMQLNALTSSYLQCCGDMVTPSVLNAVMCVLDVGFNMIFIPRYGVLGAGIGTGLACAVISLIMAWFCCFKNPRLRLRRAEKTRLNKEILRKAFQIGMPVAVQEIAMCAANVAATMIIAPLGAVAIAANAFAVTAESLCYMPGYGISDAATTLTGQSIGAGRKKLAWSFGKMTVTFGMILMGVMGALMYVFAPVLMKLLSTDAAVCALGVKVLRIEAFAEPLYGASIVCTGVLRGAGDTFVPSILNFVSLWLVRLPLSYVLGARYGLIGIWLAMCLELCFRGSVFLIRLVRRKWL